MANITTFTLTSPLTQSNAPFAFGHVFKKGDVPAGRYVNSDLTDWQAVPTTYWPDGSVRHAIIAGRVTTANNTVTVQLSDSGTDRSGTALTETDLTAALPATTLVCGSETITLADLIGTSALKRTVCAGPVMSNWLYRKQLTGSNHLVAWFDVRLYLGGIVEVFPWIENGYLTVASPTSDTRTYTFTMGGTQRFTQSLAIKHHTRVPLMTGSTFSHWETDPQITPGHNVEYMRSTKMVPNYGFTPSEALLANTAEVAVTYTPNSLGNTDAAMADTGFGYHIGILPHYAAAFCASGDTRAYKATIVNGMASGSWPVHYRDNGGSRNEPLKFTDYPDISISWDGSPTVPSGAGGVNSSASPDTSHQPSLGYLPWLLTGRWYFLDEHLFWLTWNYLQDNYVKREGASFIQLEDQIRGRGWTLRTLAQALAIVPDTHPCYASIKAAWEANTNAYEALYVTGTRQSGTWVNNLGWFGLFSGHVGEISLYFESNHSNYWWDAPWQQAIVCLAYATAWDLDLPQSTASKSSHQAVRDHGYKLPVGLAGDGSTGTYSYRRFGAYTFPVGTNYSGVPVENWFADYGAAYAVQESKGLNGSTALDALPGGSTAIRAYNRELNSGDWAATSEVAFHRAALVYAVSHGATGAQAAYDRITGASNYSETDYSSYSPIWGIAPAEAASGVVNLTGSNCTQQNTSSSGSINTAYNVPDSLRVSTTSLISGALVVGDRGLGVLGSQVPSTGTNGASYLYNDLSLPADNDYEIRGVIETWPSAGTLRANEEGSFTFSDAPDGQYTFTYRLYVSGVDSGTATVTITVGTAEIIATLSSTLGTFTFTGVGAVTVSITLGA